MTQDLKKEAERAFIIETCTRLAIERIQFRTFVPARVYTPDTRPVRALLPGHIIHALRYGYGHQTIY